MKSALLLPLFFLACSSPGHCETPIALVPAGTAAPLSIEGDGEPRQGWEIAGTTRITFRPDGGGSPGGDAAYFSVSYLDKGYGRISVSYQGSDGKNAKPDVAYHAALLDSGKWETAYFRLPSLASPAAIQIGRDQGTAPSLAVSQLVLSDAAFGNPHFRYILDEPWKHPYAGPSIPTPDNTTLKGKVMVGYQGWFATPNDPSGRGWVHWGNMANPGFSTDMWPDVSQYPPEILDKACDVKTLSGKTGYLFSSGWPEVAQIHFRWMRENNIDGAFLQRFVGGYNYVVNKTPQWALGAAREGANREGRLWAIEYDLSGVPDEKMVDLLQKDWAWLIDVFGLHDEKDVNYARVGGKPVVFLWGPGVGGRNLTPESTAKTIDFFKNDPKYGGNYVIIGGPGNWKKLGPEWLDVYKKADGFLGWMSQDYAADIAQCREMGVDYYPHVWPGFSWANLKHIPTGSTASYTPRDGGKLYEQRFTKAAASGIDRLFVGMFDEYDEGTAILPMSDDPPPTPERPGTSVKFFANSKAQENPVTLEETQIAIELTGAPPAKNIPAENFLMRWEGLIVPPADGDYTLAVEGVPNDSATLWIDDKRVLDIKQLGQGQEKTVIVPLSASKRSIYRIDYLHGTGQGRFQLVWQSSAIPRQPVPASALVDAWGRFVTNEGLPADLYLQLTGKARDMINGKIPANP